MAFDGTAWNEGLPDNNTVAHQIDDYNRDLRMGVRSRMAREHIWTASQTSTNEGGHHNFITLQAQTGAPVMAGTTGGGLYIGASSAGYPFMIVNSAGQSFTMHDSTAGGGILIPRGMIVLWSGSAASIPSGWLLCDGNNGTPNLTDRFVVGAGSTYAVAATGGTTTKNIAHTHTVPKSGWGDAGAGNTSGLLDAGPDGGNGTIHQAGNDNTTGSGGSATQDILPPYYALCYIQKA